MSVDKAFREMIRQEVEQQLRPLQSAVARLQGSSDLAALRKLAERLAPLGSLLGGAGGRALRPVLAKGRKGSGRGRRRAESGSNDRPCAIVGCKRDARSKGYCAAHYQKYRMLARTNRLPGDWVEHAAPNSVKDIVLPRGRAASKALARSRDS